MATMQERGVEYPIRLCVELMYYAGLGANGKTDKMKASEITEAIGVFFTDEQIEDSRRILSGG